MCVYYLLSLYFKTTYFVKSQKTISKIINLQLLYNTIHQKCVQALLFCFFDANFALLNN